MEVVVLLVVGGAWGDDEGLDEVDAKEAEEVDEGGYEGDDGGDLGEGDDVERSGVTDLIAPSVEEVVCDGEEKREEDGVRQVQGQRECVGGFRRRLRRFPRLNLGGPTAELHGRREKERERWVTEERESEECCVEVRLLRKWRRRRDREMRKEGGRFLWELIGRV